MHAAKSDYYSPLTTSMVLRPSTYTPLAVSCMVRLARFASKRSLQQSNSHLLFQTHFYSQPEA